MDVFGLEGFGAADVVLIEGVAAVDEDVVGLEMGEEVGDDVVDHGGGNHEPDDAGGGELLDKLFGGGGAGAAHFGKGVDGGLVAVEADALVASFDEASDHVHAHSSEAYHSELHFFVLLVSIGCWGGRKNVVSEKDAHPVSSDAGSAEGYSSAKTSIIARLSRNGKGRSVIRGRAARSV
jgi:hypothetical protein